MLTDNFLGNISLTLIYQWVEVTFKKLQKTPYFRGHGGRFTLEKEKKIFG